MIHCFSLIRESAVRDPCFIQIANETRQSPLVKPALSPPIFHHVLDDFDTGSATATGMPQLPQASSLDASHPPWMQCCRNLADEKSGKKFRKTVALPPLPNNLRINLMLCSHSMLPIFIGDLRRISSVKSGGKSQCDVPAFHFVPKKRQERHKLNAQR